MRQFHTFVGMNTDFVMTNEDIIEMKEKLKDVKSTGLQGTFLARALDNLRIFFCHIESINKWITMLNPDSVSLVTPPRTTAPKHMPAMPPIQYPTIRGVSSATAFPATFCASTAIVVVHLFKAFCIGF